MVLATGESITSEQVEYVRHHHELGQCKVVAVSDAYLLAPWAECLVSNDSNWWRNHPSAMSFSGRKFCAAFFPGTEKIKTDAFGHGINSGLQGCRVAQMLGATRILLLGFDMRGSHFFGKHPEPLRNTTPQRFKIHIQQFRKWKGCPIVNCTPGSALVQFPFMDIREALGEIRRLEAGAA